MATQATDGVWLSAHVIVDHANVGWAVAGLTEATQPQVELTGLLALLADYGVVAESVAVAMPTVPVTRLDRAPATRQRRRWTAQANTWLERAEGSLDVPVSRLDGGTDGHGEVGVDLLCVAEAIIVGHRIAELPRTASGVQRGIVLVSADEDLQVADAYTPVPVYVAMRFDRHQARTMREQQLRYLRFTDQDLRTIAEPQGDRAPVRLTEASSAEASNWGVEPGQHLLVRDGNARSSALDARAVEASEARSIAVEGAATVVVADPYGIANSLTRALGVAHLPTPEQIDEVVRALGFHDPVAQLFTVPDIPDEVFQFQLTDQRTRLAWRQRDRELERLAIAIRDHDPRTVAASARLAPERSDRHDPSRRHVEQKRVASTLIADTVWSALHAPSTRILVLTDDAEVSFALDHLHRRDPVRFGTLTRLGVHPEVQREEGAPSGASVVVLTQRDAGVLAGLDDDRYFGTAMRHALTQLHRSPRQTWRIARLDPESNGVVAESVDDARLQVVLTGVLALRDDVAAWLARADEFTTEADGWRIELDADGPWSCATPAARLTTEPQGEVNQRIGLVVTVDPQRLSIDTTGDGRADATASAWHDTSDLTPGTAITIRRRQDGRWVALAPAVTPRPQDQRVVSISVLPDGGGWVGADTAGTVAPVRAPTWWRRRLDEHPPWEVLAVRCADGSWEPLSSPLPSRPPAPTAVVGA